MLAFAEFIDYLLPELWKIHIIYVIYIRKISESGHIADCSDQDPKYFDFPFYQMKTEA